MIKFRFPLEKLAWHRKNLENLARREWIAAQREVDDALDELNALYRQVDESRERAAALSRQGGPHAVALAQIDSFIGGQKIRIERLRLKIRELQAEAERRHENLVEAAKERKTLEKLKEKRLEEFRTKMKKHELKVMDELVVTRFKRTDW